MLAEHKALDERRTIHDHFIAVGYTLGFAVVAALWAYIAFWLQ